MAMITVGSVAHAYLFESKVTHKRDLIVLARSMKEAKRKVAAKFGCTIKQVNEDWWARRVRVL